MAAAVLSELPRGGGGTPASARRYTLVAIAFHWLIAALILANLVLGWRMTGAQGLSKFTLFQAHKSIGITVLALSVLRLGWRFLNPPPAFPADMARLERGAAHAVHWAFYAAMIVMPLTGWVIVSASPLNIPTLLYGTVPLPHIGPVHDLPLASRQAVENGVGTTHALLAYLFAGLIALHVLAALKHQFIQKDHGIARMLPGRRARPEPASSPDGGRV